MPYYSLTNEPIAVIAQRWKNGEKAYDARPHGHYRVADLLPFSHSAGDSDTDDAGGTLELSLKAYGWRDSEPAFVVVGQDSRAKLVDGQRRLGVAQKLGLDHIPVTFIFEDEVPDGHITNLDGIDMHSANVHAVVFVFAMDGCGPCEEFAPRFRQRAQRYIAAGLPVRIYDAASEDPALMDLMDRCQVEATPTTVIMRRGPGSIKVEGSLSDQGIEELLQTAYRAAQRG